MYRKLLCILVLFSMIGVIAAQDTDMDVLVVDDFTQDELLLTEDEFGNDIGYVIWGDSDNVTLRLTSPLRDGQSASALFMRYEIAGFGGYSHVFTDGETRTPQDWSAYDGISFWFLGSNSGAQIQFEIFDNLNPASTGDTAERFIYRFPDDSEDWKLVEIPFSDFQRNTAWQPDGALNDGFNLDAVTGYAVALPTGSGTAYIDDIQVGMFTAADEEASEEIVEEEESETAEYVAPVVIDDFEVEELFSTRDEFNNDLGFVTWGDSDNVTLRLTNSLIDGRDTTTLFMNYAISQFGGFSHVFTDGEGRAPQDWSNHNALSFWFLGTNTGARVQFQIFDNLNPDSNGDTAERWVYNFIDDSRAWKYVEIPFRDFQRNAAWQPTGAPNDGLNLDAVTGYAIELPVGEGRANIDDITIRVVDLPELNEDGTPVEGSTVTSIEIDNSITWDSREWELLWSDEFDLEAGATINQDYWSCEEGGWGWGNNEAEYYTCRPENVSHDGNGNLVITAIEENLEGSECWYGNCTHTSARIVTRDKVEFTYGRVEARIRIPEGQGLWPAFWMLGADFPEIGWPDSGEIDIMENVGFEPRTVHGTIHGPGYSGGNAIGNSLTVDEPLADDFHVYAIDWDPNVIRWYIDGELYGIISVNDMRGTPWAFNHDFFILMNVAVGGNWPGYPSPATEFPQTMTIDYVRVYQLAD